MKLLACILWFTASANAVVITLGPSTQPVTLTGLGANAAGTGTTRVTWGACTFDGTNTSCTVSGPYTGLGNGGTYTFLLMYPGNGLSPLGTVAVPPGSNMVQFSLTAGSFGFTITPTGGTAIPFYDLNFNFDYDTGTSSCVGVPNCAVGLVGTTPGSSITGPIHGAFDLTPIITVPGGVSTASAYGGSPALAPGTWIEIYGRNLATVKPRVWGGDDFKGAQAPTSLAGTTVTVAGKPAYVDYASSGQVNAQLPSGIPTGNQKLVITTAGGDSIGTTVTINPVQPGILAPAAFKLGAGQYAVALFPDNVTYVLPTPVSGVRTAKAKPGDTIILYGVGFGPVSPNIDAGTVVGQANSLPNFQASFAGVPATIQFAGLVAGNVGLYQFNVVVPKVPANDATPFTFSLGGNTGTQTLILPITN